MTSTTEEVGELRRNPDHVQRNKDRTCLKHQNQTVHRETTSKSMGKSLKEISLSLFSIIKNIYVSPAISF